MMEQRKCAVSRSSSHASAKSMQLARPSHSKLVSPRTLLRRLCKATEGDDDFESLFTKELRKRGLEGSGSGDESTGPSKSGSFSDSAKKDPFQSSGATKTKARSPPPMSTFPSELDDQRQRSVSLVNEGLAGLIPRGSVLLQLGASVFLAFLPFMLAFSLLFTGVYAVFGDSFLHGGSAGSGPPPYVDPQYLLSNPTVDPYVPYR